jgi:hypothetical protein
METKRRQSQRTCRIEARKKMSNKKNTKKRDTAMSISPPKTQRK